MKRSRLGFGVVALAAIAACATAAADRNDFIEDDAGAPLPPEGEDGGDVVDATVADALDANQVSRCGSGGWCFTELPDEDLNLRDIRPFEERAFAVAESPSVGLQFLEWEKATDAWKYVGDGTQAQFDRGKYAGNMWAASENEVYFTLAPAFVYHGTRPDPSSPFTWKVSRLDDPQVPPPAHDPGRVWTANTLWTNNSPASRPPRDYFAPSLGVEGMPWGEVYAWYGGTLFRRTVAEDGGDAWVVEHVLADAEYPDDEFHIQSIAGGASDDFWIGGVRALVAPDDVRERACPLLVQRRADGYHHVVDHVINPTSDNSFIVGACGPKPNAERFAIRTENPALDAASESPNSRGGWLQSLHQIGPNTIVGLSHATNLVYVKTDGYTTLARSNAFELLPAVTTAGGWLNLYYGAIYMTEEGGWASGNGNVVSLEYNPSAWSRAVGVVNAAGGNPTGAGTFTLSPIGRGAPLDTQLLKVRGTSNSNVWVIGDRHAFHKTTFSH